jgi:hypothetical protein
MLKCDLCDYITLRSYNLHRHMVLKHIETSHPNMLIKENILAKKENILAKKENIFEQNTGKEDKNIPDENRCDKCKRVFSSRWYAQKHEEKCTGSAVIHQCVYCKKEFSFSTSKYRHQKCCVFKHSQVSLPSQSTSSPSTSTSKSTFSNSQIPPVEMHMHIHAGTSIQNIQHIENHNHIHNIVIYNPDNPSFLTDHIDGIKLKEILNQPSEKHIVSSYSRELLDRVENQCIRKTNLRSSHSQVHIGNNQWQSLLDKDLYPKLMCTIANGFCDFLTSKQDEKHLKIRKHIFEKLIPFLDYLSDSGYCNDEERQKEILENFNTLVQELKLIAFDLSKKTKGLGLQPSPSSVVVS